MLPEVERILSNATPEQIKFVYARLTCKTDQEAAKAIGLHRTTVGRWANKAQLDEAIRLMLRQPVQAALSLLEDAAIDSARVLIDELGSKGRKMEAAESILDRVGVPRRKRHEVTGEGGGDIGVQVRDERAKLLEEIAKRMAAEGVGGAPGLCGEPDG